MADRPTCVCGSVFGPFIIDRSGERLCPICADESQLCMQQTWGRVPGECLLPINHDGPHDADPPGVP